MKLQFDLPGVAPSVNHMYQDKWIKGRKFRVLTPDAENWITLVQILAKNEARKKGWKITRKGTKVIVEITAYFPDKRLRDINNQFKALCDALEGIVYQNDYWALPRVMDILIDKQNPRLAITIYKMKTKEDDS